MCQASLHRKVFSFVAYHSFLSIPHLVFDLNWHVAPSNPEMIAVQLRLPFEWLAKISIFTLECMLRDESICFLRLLARPKLDVTTVALNDCFSIAAAPPL